MAYDRQLADRLRAGLKSVRGLEEKSMFGGIGFLVNGNLACGVNKDDLIVRLSEADFEAALKRPHVRIFNMTGRPMKGWILVEKGGYQSSRDLQAWIDRALAHARTLPAKRTR